MKKLPRGDGYNPWLRLLEPPGLIVPDAPDAARYWTTANSIAVPARGPTDPASWIQVRSDWIRAVYAYDVRGTLIFLCHNVTVDVDDDTAIRVASGDLVLRCPVCQRSITGESAVAQDPVERGAVAELPEPGGRKLSLP